MDDIYTANRHNSHKWYGPLYRVIALLSNDIAVKSKRFYPVNKPLDTIKDVDTDELSENDYSRGRIKKPTNSDVFDNTIKSKFLGPTEHGEKCYVCGLKLASCPSHTGVIYNTADYVKPNVSDIILAVLKMICISCGGVVTSNKCSCGAELPSVTKLHGSSYLITTPGDPGKVLQLDTVQKINGYLINKIGPIRLKMLVEKNNPDMSKNIPFSSLTSNLVLVSGNTMRLDSFSPTKGQIIPLVDNIKLNAIVPGGVKRSREEIIRSVANITEYLSHYPQVDDDDDKTLFQNAQGKEGYIRRSLFGKHSFGSARIVAACCNTLLDDEIGININTANSFKVRVKVTQKNVNRINKIISDPEITHHALIVRNGRSYNITNDSDELPTSVNIIACVGDTVFRPLMDGDVLIVSRHPIKGETSTVALKVVVFTYKKEAAYMNYRVAQKLSGDFDGDEMTFMLMLRIAQNVSTILTMGPANTAHSEMTPGISLEMSSDAISGLIELSVSEETMSTFQFLDFFRQVRIPAYYNKTKKIFTCKDILSSVLIPTGLNYEANIYEKDSPEWQYWGPKNSVLKIVNGIFISGALVDWTISNSSKSMFTKLSETQSKSVIVRLSNTMHLLGLIALRYFGSGQQADNLVSRGHGYVLNKAACMVKQARVESMLDAALMPSTVFVNSSTTVAMAQSMSMPQADLVAYYFANLVEGKDSSGRSYNDFKVSMMAGLGLNSRHAFKIVGYGDLIVNSGMFISSFLAHNRQVMSLRVGEIDAATVGMNVSNMSIGSTNDEQLNTDFIAVISFIIKTFQVATAGTNLNEGKAFFESQSLNNLMEVVFNGYKVSRYFGTCGLEPGLCVYVRPKFIVNQTVAQTSFLGSEKMYKLYTQIHTSEKNRYEKEQSYDIYGFSDRRLVYWDHEMIMNYAKSKAALWRVKQTVTHRFYDPDASDKTIVECYEMFIESLYQMCGNPTPMAWRESISFIMLYFMTMVTPLTIKINGLNVMKHYMDYVRLEYEKRAFCPGTPIGGKTVDSTLTDNIQRQLDAPKKPGAALEKSLLKNMISVDKPQNGAMYIFVKPGLTEKELQRFAFNLVEVHIDDVIDKNSFVTKYNNDDNPDKHKIQNAIRYYHKTNSIIDIDTYFECKFYFSAMVHYDVTIIKVLSAIAEKVSKWQVLPLEVTKKYATVMVVFDDLTMQRSIMETLLSIKVNGIDGISASRLVRSPNGTPYILTKGINMDDTLILPNVDENRTVCDNIIIMQDLIGIHGAQAALSMIGMFVFENSDVTYISNLIKSRCVSGVSVPANRFGIKRFMHSSIYKLISIQPPFASMTKLALTEAVEKVYESVISAMAAGGIARSGTNYNIIALNTILNKTIINDKDEVKQYLKNMFDT